MNFYKGGKNMKNHELNEKYNPKDFEERLYQDWEEKGYFKPSMDKTKEAYSIMMLNLLQLLLKV